MVYGEKKKKEIQHPEIQIVLTILNQKIINLNLKS